MSFASKLKDFVLAHPAINNSYLTRFSEGRISKEEFKLFSVQFFAFVKHFPRILATLLANTPDNKAADELVKILTSELGDGEPRRRHEYLYHKFLISIGIDPNQAAKQEWLSSTVEYIEGLAKLYSHKDYSVALGASFGLEHMAISMWDQLIPGIMHLKQKEADFAKMNTVYWTFHRALEEQHEESMNKALEDINAEDMDALRKGCSEVLDYLAGFWLGLEARKETCKAA
ncbi:MAG: iron-containing redox enzyme family protein [Blastocatellia bacterium]|nr:iron-containing redox enzyme family protein [Blastocatellia bacterium]